MKLAKDTKKLIGDLAVTVVVFTCLAFLVWILYFFQHNKIVLQVIHT